MSFFDDRRLAGLFAVGVVGLVLGLVLALPPGVRSERYLVRAMDAGALILAADGERLGIDTINPNQGWETTSGRDSSSSVYAIFDNAARAVTVDAHLSEDGIVTRIRSMEDGVIVDERVAVLSEADRIDDGTVAVASATRDDSSTTVVVLEAAAAPPPAETSTTAGPTTTEATTSTTAASTTSLSTTTTAPSVTTTTRPTTTTTAATTTTRAATTTIVVATSTTTRPTTTTTRAPATTTTTRPTTTTTRVTTTTRPATTTTRPTTTTTQATTTTTRATTTTTRATTTTTQTYTAQQWFDVSGAGAIEVRCQNGSVSFLQGWRYADWSVEVEDRGPVEVRVAFYGPDYDTRIRVSANDRCRWDVRYGW